MSLANINSPDIERKIIIQMPAIISILVGVIVLLGWWFKVEVFTRIIANFLPMHPLSALFFILAGTALILIVNQQDNVQILVQVLALGIVLLGLINLFHILSFLPSWLDNWMYIFSVRPDTGKMPPTTVVNILLVGTALFISYYERNLKWNLSQILILIVVILSLFSITGYIYAPFSFSFFSPFYPMALHAALTFLVLSLAILNLHPKKGFMQDLNSRHLGGRTARYFIPIAIFVPIILGIIRLEGERRGYYQTGFGVAITTLGSIIIFLLLIWRYSKSLNKASRTNKVMLDVVVEQKDFIQKVTDTTPNTIFIYDLVNQKNLYLNVNGLVSLGYSPVEVQDLGNRLLQTVVHPGDLVDLENFFHSFGRAEDNEIKSIEYRLKMSSDEYHWALTKCSIFKRNSNGAPIEVIGVTSDINARKMAELELAETNKELAVALEELQTAQEQMVHLNNELEKKVDERTSMLAKREEQLVAKNQELQRLNYMLDNFMHMAAHDLRGPLANLKLIPAVLAKVTDEQKRSYVLNSIDVLVSQLDQVLMGILKVIDFQTISDKSGATDISFEQVFLSVKEQLIEQLGNPEGKIGYNFNSAPTIYFIEPYIRSIFFNLLSNAYKYANPGKELYVNITSKREEGFVVLAFEDNGSGIDLKKYGKDLFKPYSRLNREKNGKGLGLYLLKNIIERNHGKIEVESQPNEGVKFILYLKEYELATNTSLE